MSFLGHFLPFYPTIYPKNKIWKKCKNTPGDIILLHICSINEDHMMYGSCNTRHGKQNFLSFWAIFLHLTLLATQKINIFKKMKKKLWRDYHFTLVYHKWWSYDVWFLRHETQNTIFFVIFNYFFLPPNNPENQNFEKMERKKARDITIFHMSTMNDNHMMYGSWNMKRDRQNFFLHHFMQVYQKSRSYAILLLRYGVWGM